MLSGACTLPRVPVSLAQVIEERLVQIVQEYTRKMSLRDDNPNAVIPHVGPSMPMNDMTEQCPYIRAPDTNG